jgi:hypothetical protein
VTYNASNLRFIYIHPSLTKEKRHVPAGAPQALLAKTAGNQRDTKENIKDFTYFGHTKANII